MNRQIEPVPRFSLSIFIHHVRKYHLYIRLRLHFSSPQKLFLMSMYQRRQLVQQGILRCLMWQGIWKSGVDCCYLKSSSKRRNICVLIVLLNLARILSVIRLKTRAKKTESSWMTLSTCILYSKGSDLQADLRKTINENPIDGNKQNNFAHSREIIYKVSVIFYVNSKYHNEYWKG